MFIIPCKYNGTDLVFNCINNIRRHYKDEKIVVVDSCSELTDHLIKLKRLNIEVIKNNSQYEFGAYKLAYNKYPNEKRYFCIHDSLLINQTLPAGDVLVIQYFHNNLWDSEAQKNKAKMICEECDAVFNENTYGTVGTMFIVNNQIMDNLIKTFEHVVIENKTDSQMMERVVGMKLSEIGYDISKVALQGIHLTQDSQLYNSTFVTKLFSGRQ